MDETTRLSVSSGVCHHSRHRTPANGAKEKPRLGTYP